MPKTTPKRKNKSRKKYAVRILRGSPGKKEHKHKRIGQDHHIQVQKKIEIYCQK